MNLKRKEKNVEITRYLIKKTKNSPKKQSEKEELNDPEYVKLQEKINRLKDKIKELEKEKSELLDKKKLPKAVDSQYLPKLCATSDVQAVGWSQIQLKYLQLKLHEWAGLVITAYTNDYIYVKFWGDNGVEKKNYFVKFNILRTNEGLKWEYDKCFVPPSVKMEYLLIEYPVSTSPKKLINAIAAKCQVFHNIESQLNELKKTFASRNLNIFYTDDYRYIKLTLKMYYSSTGNICTVNIELQYDTEKPRPKSVLITCDGNDEKKLSQLQKQFIYFQRYKLLNAFEIGINKDNKMSDSVFHWYDFGASEVYPEVELPEKSDNKNFKEGEKTLFHDESSDSNLEEAEKEVEIQRQQIKNKKGTKMRKVTKETK